MKRSLTIETSTTIQAPVERVWKITALEFEHIDRWDGNVKESRAFGSAAANAPVGGRVCNMYGGGTTKEKIVEFDEVNRSFAYEITEGLPGFVLTARNTWTHEAIAGGHTKLTMRIDMQLGGIMGIIMQTPIRFQMGKVLGKAQEELKHFIETERVHPRKSSKLK